MNSFRFKILSYVSALLILSILVMSVGFQTRTKTILIENEMHNSKNILDTVQLYIANEQSNLEEYRNLIISKRTEQMRHLSQLVKAYFDDYYNRARRGEMSFKKAKRLALEGVKTFRYAQNDYFFIFNSNLKLLSHPNKKLIGIDANKVADKKGKLHIKEIYAQAIKNGEGITDYHWNRLGKEGDFKKVGYGTLYKKWDWLIVSGVYIDDVETQVKARLNQVIINLRKLFRNIKMGENSYLYIFDEYGDMIIHPLLEGENVKSIINPNSKTSQFEEHKQAAHENRPYEYYWNRPDDPDNYSYKKFAFVRYFKPLGWYIASSIYDDDLRDTSRTVNKELLIIAILTVFAFLLSAFILSKSLVHPINSLSNAIRHLDITDLAHVNIPIIGTRETKTLGRFLQELITAINDRIQEKKLILDELRMHKNDLEKIVRDRTKELDEKNKNLQKAIDDLERAKDQLVAQEKLASLGAVTAGIAHEIKNPINLIVNSAKLVDVSLKDLKKDIDVSSDAQECVETLDELSRIIVHNSNRCDKIIASMLMQSGSKKGELELTDLKELINEYWNLSYHSLKANYNVDVVLELNIEELGKIPVYSKDLGRILINAFDNAFYALMEKRKSTTEFTPKIEVKLVKIDGQFYELRIKDNGAGVPKEVLDKIMDPFFTTKPTGSGTGLGLSMAHDMILAQEGKFNITSEPGEFTEVIITLPLSPK